MKKIALIALFVSSSSFAAQNQSQNSADAPKQVTFEEIKMACENPARFHNQTAPTNIQITCKDVQYKWVPDTKGTLNMTNARKMTASIYSDKYTVAPVSLTARSAPQTIECAKFKEVSQIVETARAISCEELVAFKGNLGDFCAQASDSILASNLNAARMEATGKVYSQCGGGTTVASHAQQGTQAQQDMEDEVTHHNRPGRSHHHDSEIEDAHHRVHAPTFPGERFGRQ